MVTREGKERIMSSPHLRWGAVFWLGILTLIWDDRRRVVDAQACYFPNGKPVTQDTPCNPRFEYLTPPLVCIVDSRDFQCGK